MPTIRVNDIDLYYEIRGSGEPLLLIAGFACDHTMWSGVVSALAAHFSVIAFDNRGMGQASCPDTAFTIRDLAADATGLLDALGVGPVHVAGHSMGGMIAQELALAQPERVRTLTLLSSCARLDDRGKAIIESWGGLPQLVDAVTATRLILPWMYTNRFYARPGAVEQVIEQIMANPHPPSLQAIQQQSRAIGASDTTARLGEIKCPILVLVGSEDILLPPAFSEQIARAIPGAELVQIPGTAHGLLVESPELVAAAMLKFLLREPA